MTFDFFPRFSEIVFDIQFTSDVLPKQRTFNFLISFDKILILLSGLLFSHDNSRCTCIKLKCEYVDLRVLIVTQYLQTKNIENLNGINKIFLFDFHPSGFFYDTAMKTFLQAYKMKNDLILNLKSNRQQELT